MAKNSCLPKLSHRGLYILACILWLFAGTKVLVIAVESWSRASFEIAGLWFLGSLGFFSGFIFRKVVPRYIAHIAGHEEQTIPLYRCFQPSSWATMVFMIALGIGIRISGIAGDDFISGFYTGLGISLLCNSIYYLRPIRLGYQYRYDRQ